MKKRASKTGNLVVNLKVNLSDLLRQNQNINSCTSVHIVYKYKLINLINESITQLKLLY